MSIQGGQLSFASGLIIDDHPLFCDALAMTLKSLLGMGEIATADRLETAIRRLERGPAPDVIILDLDLPDVSGVEGVIRLRSMLGGQVPLLVVSSLTDDRVIAAVMAAGASGFVPKHARREAFLAAFEALREGRSYLPEGYISQTGPAGETPRHEALQRLGLLTRQQAKILQLVCEGKLNKQIAFELTIAETTVKAHVTAIMRKLGVQSRTQAVLIAAQASFVSLMPEDG